MVSKQPSPKHGLWNHDIFGSLVHVYGGLHRSAAATFTFAFTVGKFMFTFAAFVSLPAYLGKVPKDRVYKLYISPKRGSIREEYGTTIKRRFYLFCNFYCIFRSLWFIIGLQWRIKACGHNPVFLFDDLGTF